MRRVIVVLMAFFGLAFAAGNRECYSVAQQLHDLQNRIVKQAFEDLQRGDWALYSDGTKAVYLGQKRIQGQKLYGVEVQMKMPMQIWYGIAPKDVVYDGRTIRFLTIDPTLFLVQTNMGVLMIDKSQIGLYTQMMGGSLSTIFTPAQIKTPPDCTHVPEIKKILYRLPSQRSVDAVKISDKSNGYIVVSEKVPFGMLEVVDAQGRYGFKIKSFGHGGKILIGEEAQRSAQPLPVIPSMPGNFPVPPVPMGR